VSDSAGTHALHLEPVWRDRADFIIDAPIPDGVSKQYEQLWARRVSTLEFEICCIPFFLYDLSLGDVVGTVPDHGQGYILDRVIRPSGRFTFRVFFGHSFRPREEIVEQIRAMGSLVEWSSVNMVAVDALDDKQAATLADFLAAREDEGKLIYETGRTR
jgi:hypothetical protein